MPSLSQIAAHLGVSKARAAQLKKEGMPVTTLRAAMLFRKAMPLKRSPTNGKNKGMPVKPGAKLQPKRGRPRIPPKPAKTGDSLSDALQNSILVADAAFWAYQTAVGTPESSVRLSEHSKALDSRLKAEKAYREEAERRGLLVTKSEIIEIARRCMDAVLRRLKKLPIEQGPQCNPQEPLMAVRILEREVNEIISAGHAALTDL